MSEVHLEGNKYQRWSTVCYKNDKYSLHSVLFPRDLLSLGYCSKSTAEYAFKFNFCFATDSLLGSLDQEFLSMLK